jgi:hypothetical protein
MNRIHNYPVWLSVFMLFGPFLMISWIGLKNSSLIWAAPIAGAGMVIFALFYLSKRLHEQMQEVATLRQLLNGTSNAPTSE